MKKVPVLFLITAFLVSMAACAGPTQQQRGLKTGAIIGAAAGAILGQAIGRDTEATLLGAGIGAAVGGLAGHQVGAYMDRQQQELQAVFAASEAASVRRTQDVLTATFQSEVLFDFDSATLKPGAYSEMARVAGVLNRYPQTTIRIEGHTDATGPEDYNQRLSEKRAEAVKNALVQQAVSPSRMFAIGFGESQPVSSNNAMNRRVNIVIIPIV